MNPANFMILMQTIVMASCIVAAAVAIWFGFRLYQPTQAAPRMRLLGAVLMLSSLGWGVLAYQQRPDTNSALAMLSIEQLPATAAGIAPDAAQTAASAPSQLAADTSASKTASVATFAEELASEPHNPDFQKLRDHVTHMLYSSEQFDRYPNPVLLNIPKDEEGQTIRYLVEERPGLLTVIYHAEDKGEKRTLVYWPQVAGDQLIFTPLSGPSTQALSDLVQEVLTH